MGPLEIMTTSDTALLSFRLTRMKHIVDSLEEAGWDPGAPAYRPEQFESLQLLKGEIEAAQLALKPLGCLTNLSFLRRN